MSFDNEKNFEYFNSIDSNDSSYIENFINAIYTALTKRNTFVENSSDNLNKEDFLIALKKQLIKLDAKNKKIQFLSSGHTSLAFKVGNKVIKIGKSKVDTRKYKKDFYCVIPLFFEGCYKMGERNYYTLQVLPYVDTLNISEEQLYPMYKKLRELGYIWNDPTINNIGRIIEDFDYNGYHYKKNDLIIIDLEDIAYVGKDVSDLVLEEIAYSSYNKNVYNFEMKYICENKQIIKLK